MTHPRQRLVELRDHIDRRREDLGWSIKEYGLRLGLPGIGSIMHGPPTRRLRPDEAERLAADLQLSADWFAPVVTERAVHRVRAPKTNGDVNGVPPLREAFAGWLRKEFVARDVSELAAANAIGIRLTSVRDWTHGIFLPSASSARRLARVIERDPDVFIATLRGLRTRANEQVRPIPERTVLTMLDAVPRRSTDRGSDRGATRGIDCDPTSRR